MAVKQAEAAAIEGENLSAIDIAKSNAVRAEQEAAAYQAAEAAKRIAEAMIRTRLSDFTFPFHFHALEKEMATHSGVLA